jgi:HlyD family secretion protein
VADIRTTPPPATQREPDEALSELLGSPPHGSRLARLGRWLAIGGILVALFAAGYAWFSRAGTAAPQYRTAPVTRGDLVVNVTATGNLQPTNQVDVGSELSGTIESVRVDVNDKVKRGQVLARLDTTRLEHQVEDARGGLAAAQAQVRLATATVRETQLQFDRLKRMHAASKGTVPAQIDLDTAEAAWQRAVAAKSNAIAAVARARAMLNTGQTNLSKATIRSPIDGVVLARSIEPGQTVAASLQAPVLFVLAEDLSKMELQVDVDEADVGQVRDGQPAQFTVDAYPGREYPATVRRVSYGSQVKDGVVSYLTELTVNNDDLSLRPGMTATAQITVNERRNVLLVPAAALRFTPTTDDGGKTPSRSVLSRLVPRPPHRSTPKKVAITGRERQVWVLRDGKPVAVKVTLGATDGRMYEIVSGALEPGMDVILDRNGTSS